MRIYLLSFCLALATGCSSSTGIEYRWIGGQPRGVGRARLKWSRDTLYLTTLTHEKGVLGAYPQESIVTYRYWNHAIDSTEVEECARFDNENFECQRYEIWHLGLSRPFNNVLERVRMSKGQLEWFRLKGWGDDNTVRKMTKHHVIWGVTLPL